MTSIRSLQQRLRRCPVQQALFNTYRAMSMLDTAVVKKQAPDAHVADLLAATLVLADALGVDVETALKARLIPQGSLLTPMRAE